jgi:hypothetical protein
MADANEAPSVIEIPSWFTTAAVLALVWNLLGVMAFAGQMMMTPEMIAELPQAEQDLYASTPVWATIAFAVAVIAGALGCVGLLMKKSWCYQLFVASFLSVIIQMFHSFFISNSFEVYGPGSTIMPIMVIVIAFVLVRFSAKGNNNNWFS